MRDILRLTLTSSLMLSLSVLVIWPFFNAIKVSNVILFSFNIIVSSWIFLVHWKRNQRINIIWIIAHASFLYLTVLSIIGNNTSLIGRFSEYLLIPNSLQFLIYCKRNFLLKELKIVMNSNFFILTLTSVTTLIALLQDPQISRMISDDTSLQYRNIGGFGFVYALLFYIIAIQVLLKPREFKRNGKIIWILVIFILFSVLLMSRYLIANLMLLNIILMSLYHKRIPFNFKSRVIRFAIFSIGCLSAFYLFFTLYSSNSYLIVKFLDIFITIISSGESSYLTERVEKYAISIRGFLEFPILGVLGNGERAFNWEWYGRHSYILDNFALFGFVGGVFSVLLLLAPWYFYRKYFDLDSTTVILAIIMIGIQALLNIITPELIVTAYLIVPAAHMLAQQNDNGRLNP